ncbi:MAG: hypothetical protein SF029_08235 [bacterium]|nr:hypothetical protein [bacterium]
MARVLSRLLALSLLVIALLWAYSRNRMTREEHEAVKQAEAARNLAEYYYRHPSRKAEHEASERDWDAWYNSEDSADFRKWEADLNAKDVMRDAIERV